MSLQTIPIVVGVTGHRDLRDEDIPALKRCVRNELERIMKEYPNSTVIMLNSLAEGADTLCANVALECGISLKCPLPMEIDEYCKDFEGNSLHEFNSLIYACDDVFVVRADELTPTDDADTKEATAKLRDDAYRRAGVYIADHSTLLIALWDGSKAEPGDCGTSAIVDYALHDTPAVHDTPIVHNTPIEEDKLAYVKTGAVFHVATPRRKNTEVFPVAATLMENRPGTLSKVLGEIESFNRRLK